MSATEALCDHAPRVSIDTLYEEQAAFIGHKGLGDEFTQWALNRRAEADALLAEAEKRGYDRGYQDAVDLYRGPRRA